MKMSLIEFDKLPSNFFGTGLISGCCMATVGALMYTAWKKGYETMPLESDLEERTRDMLRGRSVWSGWSPWDSKVSFKEHYLLNIQKTEEPWTLLFENTPYKRRFRNIVETRIKYVEQLEKMNEMPHIAPVVFNDGFEGLLTVIAMHMRYKCVNFYVPKEFDVLLYLLELYGILTEEHFTVQVFSCESTKDFEIPPRHFAGWVYTLPSSSSHYQEEIKRDYEKVLRCMQTCDNYAYLLEVPRGYLFSSYGGFKEEKTHFIYGRQCKGVISSQFSTAQRSESSAKVSEKDFVDIFDKLILTSSFPEIDKYKISFMDSSFNTLKSVSPEEIRSKNYNLLPAAYLDNSLIVISRRFANSTLLGTVFDFTRGITIKPQTEGILCRELTVSDIGDDGFIREPKKEVYIPEEKEGQYTRLFLRPGDLVLAIKGKIGKVGRVPDTVDPKIPWLVSQTCMILRLKRRGSVKPDYPYAEIAFVYLRSKPVQKYLTSTSSGTSITCIKVNDLKTLPLPLPNKNTAMNVVRRLEEEARLYDLIRKAVIDYSIFACKTDDSVLGLHEQSKEEMHEN